MFEKSLADQIDHPIGSARLDIWINLGIGTRSLATMNFIFESVTVQAKNRIADPAQP
jgi:hypothetical protein